jgi:hypothetical protein
MSVSGVAVSAAIQPSIGTPLAVGACVGRVARLLPDGFAVKFVETQNREDLERRITRDAPRATGGRATARPPQPSSADAPPTLAVWTEPAAAVES